MLSLAGRIGGRGVLFIPQLAARDFIGAGFRRRCARLLGVRRGLLAVGFRFAVVRRLRGRARRRFLRGGLGLVTGVFVRFNGRRSVFLLEQTFHQRLVGQGRAQIRLTFQRLFVSIQRGFQLTAFGQGVATIVVGVGVVAFGEPLGGAAVVAGLVERHALPLSIFEMLRGLGRALSA